MPYCLSKGVSAAAEVNRIFEEECASALEQVSGPATGAESDKAIHTARKSLKKLRALLRLISPHISKRLYRKENEHLRSVAHKLSELRDAHVMAETFDDVQEDLHLEPPVVEAAKSFLAENKSQIDARLNREQVFGEVVEAVKEASERLTKLSFRTDGFGLLETGLHKAYKRGKQAKKTARKENTAEAFHNWRKRVKDHWYHVRLLGEVTSTAWAQRREQLDELEGLLGDDHNLAVLAEHLRKDARLEPICGKLAEMSAHLQAEALALGKALYGSKWSGVASELEDAHMLWPAKLPAAGSKTETKRKHSDKPVDGDAQNPVKADGKGTKARAKENEVAVEKRAVQSASTRTAKSGSPQKTKAKSAAATQ